MPFSSHLFSIPICTELTCFRVTFSPVIFQQMSPGDGWRHAFEDAKSECLGEKKVTGYCQLAGERQHEQRENMLVIWFIYTLYRSMFPFCLLITSHQLCFWTPSKKIRGPAAMERSKMCRLVGRFEIHWYFAKILDPLKKRSRYLYGCQPKNRGVLPRKSSICS